MRVALCYNLNRGENEKDAEFDLPLTINALKTALSERHEVLDFECCDNYLWVTELIKQKPDIIFNVAEGFVGNAREAFYPTLFEQLGIKYAGPGPAEMFICQNKHLTKYLLKDYVNRALSICIDSPEQLLHFKDNLKFPLLVKLNCEGSSMGITKKSIVTTYEELVAQVSSVYDKYHTQIIAEEYISGRDLSMTYIEGLGIFGPVEYIYPKENTMYDYTLKTVENERIDVVKPIDISLECTRELFSMTQAIVDRLDLKGYARIDYRLSDHNVLYFLEVNAQVCFHPIGAFVLAAEQSKYTFSDIVLHITEYYSKKDRTDSCPINNEIIL